MKAIITIAMDNAAFEDKSELSRILRQLAQHVEGNFDGGEIFDINGNPVGAITFWED